MIAFAAASTTPQTIASSHARLRDAGTPAPLESARVLEICVAGRGGPDRDTRHVQHARRAAAGAARALIDERSDDDGRDRHVRRPGHDERHESALGSLVWSIDDEERADREARADGHDEPARAGSHHLLTGDEAHQHDGDERDAESDDSRSADRVSPLTKSPHSIGAIAETTAVSGERMLIGPIARHAYSSAIAIDAERARPAHPTRHRPAPIHRRRRGAQRQEHQTGCRAAAVTTIERRRLAASPPKKSAAP